MQLRPLILLPLVGCAWFEGAKDTVEGALNPLVGVGIVLGVEAPETELVDLAALGTEQGTAATLFLADAKEVNDLENAPVDDATVTVTGNVDAEAARQGDGLYLVEPDQGLEYAAADTWSITIERGEATSSAAFTLPSGVGLSVPPHINAGEDLAVDFSGNGYNAAIVVVVNVESGEVVFDNRPEGIQEYYQFLTGQAPTLVTIPGSTFAAESSYAIGAAGLTSGAGDDLENMNTVLSKFMSGTMRFAGTTTRDLPPREVAEAL